MTDEELMREAIAEAEKAAALGEVPVGAVLARGSEILCRAHNLRETAHDTTAHAEILCLRRGAGLIGDWRLRGCTLYVTLEPCPMCAGAIALSQLDLCVYGAADPQRGCLGSVYDLAADPAMQSRTRWQAGVLAKECEALLREFFENARSS